MTGSHRTLRSLIVALLSLVLAAGVAAAARPDGEELQGLERAAEVSGKTVPVEAEEPAEEPVEQPADDEEGDKGEDGENGAGDEKEHPENHGKYVSEAARGETRVGWDNHGAYVRSIAQSDVGKPGDDAAADEDGDEDVEAVTTRKAKPAHGRGHGANR